MNALDSIYSKDPELNGKISHALHSGHDFSYWLAQLGTWVDERPNVVTPNNKDEAGLSSLPKNFYRQAPLSASNADFEAVKIQSQLIQQSQLTALRLWQSMHPDPLSLYNDGLRLEDEVIENCELHVRQRLKSQLPQPITPDPTLLESIIPVEREWLIPA